MESVYGLNDIFTFAWVSSDIKPGSHYLTIVIVIKTQCKSKIVILSTVFTVFVIIFTTNFLRGTPKSSGGVVVRALASHERGPGSISRLGTICGDVSSICRFSSLL